MANKKTSQLTDGVAVASGDLVPVSRPIGGGAYNSRKVPLGDAAGKDTGTGAGNVSAGNHNHDSTYAALAGSASQAFAAQTLELGHASDTTLARVAAGRISVEGVELQKQPSSDGIVVRTAAGSVANRSIAAGTGGSVSNGDGVSGNPTVGVDKASDANVRSAASNKVITADLVESASALVTLTETSGAVAVDWDSFINGQVTVDENTVISNPTNGQPGTWRTIRVIGNNGTDRTITFGNQFLNVLPTILDCDSGRPYLLLIYCETASVFLVFAQKARNA